MKNQLKEKLILEEPEDKLPDVKMDEPIVISTEPESEENKINVVGIKNVISSEISNVYNNISDLNGLLLTISEDLPERTDIQDVLNEIINERTIHVGMLQSLIGMLDANASELVKTGEEVATNIAGEPEANQLNNN